MWFIGRNQLLFRIQWRRRRRRRRRKYIKLLIHSYTSANTRTHIPSNHIYLYTQFNFNYGSLCTQKHKNFSRSCLLLLLAVDVRSERTHNTKKRQFSSFWIFCLIRIVAAQRPWIFLKYVVTRVERRKKRQQQPKITREGKNIYSRRLVVAVVVFLSFFLLLLFFRYVEEIVQCFFQMKTN